MTDNHPDTFGVMITGPAGVVFSSDGALVRGSIVIKPQGH